MTKAHYSGAISANLAEYLEAKKFRTVLAMQRDCPPGLSEIPVEIELQKKFIKTLSFNVAWDGMIYGFIRGRKELEAKTGTRITKIVMADWGEKFVVVFEQEDGKEEPVLYVSPEDVRSLLEHCLRAPDKKMQL